MIVSVAIKRGDLILSMPKPARHVHITTAINCNQLANSYIDVQNEALFIRGFLTDKGEFLNRREALDHCFREGQQLRGDPNIRQGLYSEDLWE